MNAAPGPARERWASLGENLRIAVDALRANKMRSILTVVGNVVAVMSVIAVVAVIDGMNTYVSEKVLEQGLKVVYVDKFGLITNEDEWRAALKRRDLTILDAEALKRLSRTADEVVAQAETVKRVRHGKVELQNVRILGMTEGYESVGDYELDQGRALDEDDIGKRRSVCLIGSEVAKQLFPVVDPIGRTVRVAGYELRVVGTVAARGNVLGQSQDNFVLLPLGQYQKIFGSRESITILVKARPGVDLERTEDEARVILRARRHVPIGKPDDFAITTSETYMTLYQKLTRGIFAGTIGLVAISLLVGGIVIMNIMLVAVTERTREIGIRKALGARRSDLLAQFLSETIVLSFFGGLLGVLAGIGISFLIRVATPLPASIQPWSVAVSLVVASSVGLFFGVYPATRAARLDPIVALRQE
ncbi:MAG: ABC transporter permease [Candidatus Latescibacteria bacterium]|nr:ABC transporter permease [Candidatus Latescibacterota bacterium]